jgi:hypothetical protein
MRVEWDTSGVPSGEYQLFVVTSDSLNPPVTTTWSGTVVVDSGALAPPTDLQAKRDGAQVELSWTPTSGKGAVSHLVRYTDRPLAPGYREAAPATLPGRLLLSGLDLAAGYRFCVAAYDDTGNESPCSAAVAVPPVTDRLRRHLPRR